MGKAGISSVRATKGMGLIAIKYTPETRSKEKIAFNETNEGENKSQSRL